MATNGSKTELLVVPIGKVKPAADNVRDDVGDVAELAASIGSLGLLQPLVVRRENGGYELVAGARRLAACLKAGLTEVPVVIRDLQGADRVAAMLVENLQRNDLSPLEEGRAFKRLLDEFGMTQRDLADKVGCSQGQISKRIQLLGLPAPARKELDAGGITVAEGLLLVQLRNDQPRVERAWKNRTSYGGLEHAVKRELIELENEAKAEKETKRLRDRGVNVLPWPGSNDPPAGAKMLGGWEGPRTLNLEPAKHKACPGHAATVSPRTGQVTYLCLQPSRHVKRAAAAQPGGVDVKAIAEAARQAQAKAQAAMLKARESNVALGRKLVAKLSAPAVDLQAMRLLADVILHESGGGLASSGLRYVDETLHKLVTRDDGTVSRVTHAPATAKHLRDRVAKAKTPEEVLGVLLQAIIAARYADVDALPASQRGGRIAWLNSSPDQERIDAALDRYAKAAGVAAPR